jgi:hypothetical protein
VAELEQMWGGALALWVYKILLYGCEYSENLIIITVGAPAPNTLYIDPPMDIVTIIINDDYCLPN